MPKKEKEG
jgi:ATPase family AAA domain-containing protein 3A/B